MSERFDDLDVDDPDVDPESTDVVDAQWLAEIRASTQWMNQPLVWDDADDELTVSPDGDAMDAVRAAVARANRPHPRPPTATVPVTPPAGPLTRLATDGPTSIPTDVTPPRWETPARLRGADVDAETRLSTTDTVRRTDWRLIAAALVGAVLVGAMIATVLVGNGAETVPDNTVVSTSDPATTEVGG